MPMRTGFNIIFRKQDFFFVNREKMQAKIENGKCFLQFDGNEYVVSDGEYVKINENIEVRFNKHIGQGRRGSITFFCDKSIKILRSNHPAIKTHNAELTCTQQRETNDDK